MMEARTEFVDEVVCALTGGLGAVPPRSLSDSLERAAADFDERTAEAFARALFAALESQPGDLRQREALLLLGLAHPAVFERHSISLAGEAERYAQLLRLHGEHERAAEVLSLLANSQHRPESAPTVSEEQQVLIQRLLARAEECIQRGYPRQAEEALRDVLEIDPARGDVTRMLRELRSQSARRARTHRRVALWGGSLACVLLAVAGVVRHEWRLEAAYAELPAAGLKDSAGLQQRLDALEVLLASHLPWTGTFRAWTERDRLRMAIEAEQARAADRARVEARERQQQLVEAADLRSSARVLLERGESARAIEQLSRSLTLGGEQWDQRQAVLADIAAIEAWKKDKQTP